MPCTEYVRTSFVHVFELQETHHHLRRTQAWHLGHSEGIGIRVCSEVDRGGMDAGWRLDSDDPNRPSHRGVLAAGRK